VSDKLTSLSREAGGMWDALLIATGILQSLKISASLYFTLFKDLIRFA
jgi:hypothetical protein